VIIWSASVLYFCGIKKWRVNRTTSLCCSELQEAWIKAQSGNVMWIQRPLCALQACKSPVHEAVHIPLTAIDVWLMVEEFDLLESWGCVPVNWQFGAVHSLRVCSALRASSDICHFNVSIPNWSTYQCGVSNDASTRDCTVSNRRMTDEKKIGKCLERTSRV
jgi:hypothetical protein